MAVEKKAKSSIPFLEVVAVEVEPSVPGLERVSLEVDILSQEDTEILMAKPATLDSGKGVGPVAEDPLPIESSSRD